MISLTQLLSEVENGPKAIILAGAPGAGTTPTAATGATTCCVLSFVCVCVCVCVIGPSSSVCAFYPPGT